MSIISDALKKAQSQSPSNNTSAAMTLEKPTNPSTLRDLKKVPILERATTSKSSNASFKSAGPWLAVLALILITTPVIAPYFSTPLLPGKSIQPDQASLDPQTSSAVAGNSIPEAVSDRLAQFGVEEIPLNMLPPNMVAPNPKSSSSTLPSSYSLNGIVYSEDNPMCIINNKIRRVGDAIGEAVVDSIGPNQVVLKIEGREITLSN